MDVNIDPAPTDELSLVIMDRRHSDLKPAILSVATAKARLRRANFIRVSEILPPSLHLLDIVPMNSGFPLRSHELIRRKPRVLSKSLVDEIQSAILQSAPGHRWQGVDERVRFCGSLTWALICAHRFDPASRQA
jgi:hypothetical protein